MIKLNKGELVLWQLPFETCYLQEGIPMDVEFLILTNQNIHITYIQRTPPFKRELKTVIIPIKELSLTAPVFYKNSLGQKWEFTINTQKSSYVFSVQNNNAENFEQELRTFLIKTTEVVERK